MFGSTNKDFCSHRYKKQDFKPQHLCNDNPSINIKCINRNQLKASLENWLTNSIFYNLIEYYKVTSNIRKLCFMFNL